MVDVTRGQCLQHDQQTEVKYENRSPLEMPLRIPMTVAGEEDPMSKFMNWYQLTMEILLCYLHGYKSCRLIILID